MAAAAFSATASEPSYAGPSHSAGASSSAYGGGGGSATGSGAGRRERLEAIRERETLKDELTTKFRNRLSNRTKQADEVSIASAVIRREVANFVDSDALVTVSNLARLEGRMVRQAMGCGDSDAYTVSEYTVGSVAPSASSRASRRQAQAQTFRPEPPKGPPSVAASAPRSVSLSLSARSTAPPSSRERGSQETAGPPSVRSARARPAVNWALLDKHAAAQLSQDNVRQRLRGIELQRRLRHDLELQMADVQLQKERDRQEEHNFHRLQVEDTDNWRKQELAREAARRQLLVAERQERAAQMVADRAKRDREKLEEKLEAQSLLEAATRELEEDKRRAEQRWEACRTQTQRALEVSTESSKLREESQRQILQVEDRSVEEYERLRMEREKQRREEKAREEERRLHIQQQVARCMEASRVGHAGGELPEGAMTAERRRLEAEAEKSADLAAKKQQTQAYLREQIREKQERKRVEEEKLKQHRHVQESDAKNYVEETERHERRRRLLNLEHRAGLERQMATKSISGEPDPDLMSPWEMQINKKLLDQVLEHV